VRLERFFDDFSAYLLGDLRRDELARALDPRSTWSTRDLAGLSHYAIHARAQREHIAEVVFERTSRMVVAHAGQATWSRLVDAYFRRHPQRTIAFSRNMQAFVGFVRARPREVAPWVVDLAQLDWYAFVTVCAPVPLEDASSAVTHLVPLHVVDYEHDVLSWLVRDEAGDATEPPSRAPITVAHARLPNLDLVHCALTPPQATLLRGLLTGCSGALEALSTEAEAAWDALESAGLLTSRRVGSGKVQS